MKSLVLVVLLAAAASAAFVSHDVVEAPEMIVSHEDVDPTDVAEVPALNEDITEGDSRSGRLLARSVHIRGAASNVMHVQDITFRTNSLRITAIRIIHVGAIQGSSAFIRSGGLGQNFVTIRLQSARSRGYHYQLEVYGR